MLLPHFAICWRQCLPLCILWVAQGLRFCPEIFWVAGHALGSAINYGSPYCSCLWFLFTLQILAIFDMLSRFRFIRLCTGSSSLFLQLYEMYHVVIRSQEMGDVIHTVLMCCLLAVSDVCCTLGLKCIAHLQRYMCIIESDGLVHIDEMTTILHNISVKSRPF